MMLTTSFLSMWLSNTATTAMMLPIANAILESLFGDLASLKEKCKSCSDPEDDLRKGSEQIILQTPKRTARVDLTSTLSSQLSNV